MESLVFECPPPIQTTAATISISKDHHHDICAPVQCFLSSVRDIKVINEKNLLVGVLLFRVFSQTYWGYWSINKYFLLYECFLQSIECLVKCTTRVLSVFKVFVDM